MQTLKQVIHQYTYRPERASFLVADVDVRSAEELARSVRVVVEAGAVGRVLLTCKGSAHGRRNAGIS